jgi:hypothetical protein
MKRPPLTRTICWAMRDVPRKSGGQTLWTCTRKRTTRPHEEAFPLAQRVFVQPP